MPSKNDISDDWPTIFQLAAQIPEMDLTRVGKQATVRKNANPVTNGLLPAEFPAKEGYFTVTPEQLCSLIVPKVTVNGQIVGFQREKVNAHARKIARAMKKGEEMPPIIVSIFPDGKAYVDDGQHRALGAIIARCSLEVIVKHRTVAQARKLFTNQGRAKNLRSDDTLLTGDSPLELYIQDALTAANHPWSTLVSISGGGSNLRMTPTTMAQMIGVFVYNAFNQGASYYVARPVEEFDEKMANRLADLVKAFGNKTTNPLAFRGRSLRAIAYAATHIFRRNPNVKPEDWERWMRHMPQFDFSKYPHLLGKESDMAMALIEHWNKRLPQDRRVKPYMFQ